MKIITKEIKLFETGDFVDLANVDVKGKSSVVKNNKLEERWNCWEERGLVVGEPGEIDGNYHPYYHVLTQSDIVLAINEDDMQDAGYGGHVDLGYLAGEDPEE